MTKQKNDLPEVYTNDGVTLLESRFLKKDDSGEVSETIKDMYKRVAKFIAQADANYYKQKPKIASELKKTEKEFFDALYNLKLIPNSPTLINAGRYNRLYSACFVLPIEDDLQKIMKSLNDATVVQQYGGGTGWNFSPIREKGAPVNGLEDVAAGPVHFIKSFSAALAGIRQIGKRGGGNMAILNVDHPDIEEFIHMKEQDGTVHNFNISVGITDKFMDALRNDDPFDLISRYDGSVAKTVNARELFDEIAELAWATGDPGLAFVDKINAASPTPNLGIMNATNPCGEQPLLPYESCNLAALNLRVHFDKEKNELNWDMLRDTIKTGTHFLDNIIDVNNYPVKMIEKITRHTNRKIGIGLMGFAEILFYKGIPYNSDEALDYAEKVMSFIREEAHKASIDLAKIRGTFPNYKGSTWEKAKKPVRNATTTTIAPNGNTSIIGGSSGGIEPAYSLAYKVAGVEDANAKATAVIFRVNQAFEEIAKREGFYSEELIEKIANGANVKDLPEVPEKWKKVFVTANDIEPIDHIKMQNAFQKYTDNAISKTINLLNEASIDDIKQIYQYAYDSACKGVTVYRDGSKSVQTYVSGSNKGSLNVKEDKKEEIKIAEVIEVPAPAAGLSANAVQVLEKRALKKDSNGNIVETPEELWRRIAKKIASAEIKYNKSAEETQQIEDDFFTIMNNNEFHSGGTLIWAGMDALGMNALMSKCFVLPIEDSIDGIFSTLKKNIEVLTKGGGTGFNFSHVRSTYSQVTTTGEKAAGPVEYLKTYNRAQDTLTGRGGRQMGSMAILNIDHPDIEKFIEAKDNLNELSHYNISVGISDKFMQAVENNATWDLIDPFDHQVKKTVQAKELWNKISEHAWKSGDPGLFFLDKAEKGNTTPRLGKIEATNPCGEQPLLPYESCNLGNINLSAFVNGFPFIERKTTMTAEDADTYINWDRLREVVQIGVRFLDSIIDVNNYPVPEIEEMTKKTRNIGLGVMGVADMFVKLGIPYESEGAVKLSDKVMAFIQSEARTYSEILGAEKGSFPAFEDSVWLEQGHKAMRNTRTTTIAPTGTVAIIAGCNPGIEPLFALSYTRKNSMGGTVQQVLDPLFEKAAAAFDYLTEENLKQIRESGTIDKIEGISKNFLKIFKTSHEIDPKQHVKIQAAFQRNVDSGVSKTINLPNSATKAEINEVYKLAFDLDCKGITIFRDGSKDPTLQVGTQTKKTEESNLNITAQPMKETIHKRKRPATTHGTTTEVRTDQGQLFVTINEDELGIAEVFLTIGKSGGFNAGYTEALGRLISLGLRSGIDPEEIAKQLKGIRTSNPMFNQGMMVYSVPDAVAKVLEKKVEEMNANIKMFEENQTEEINKIEDVNSVNNEQDEVLEKTEAIQEAELTYTQTSVDQVMSADFATMKTPKGSESKYKADNDLDMSPDCPDCGSSLQFAEGCILCRSCGFSKCG